MKLKTPIFLAKPKIITDIINYALEATGIN